MIDSIYSVSDLTWISQWQHASAASELRGYVWVSQNAEHSHRMLVGGFRVIYVGVSLCGSVQCKLKRNTNLFNDITTSSSVTSQLCNLFVPYFAHILLIYHPHGSSRSVATIWSGRLFFLVVYKYRQVSILSPSPHVQFTAFSSQFYYNLNQVHLLLNKCIHFSSHSSEYNLPMI
jgi:hypothetical protein